MNRPGKVDRNRDYRIGGAAEPARCRAVQDQTGLAASRGVSASANWYAAWMAGVGRL